MYAQEQAAKAAAASAPTPDATGNITLST